MFVCDQNENLFNDVVGDIKMDAEIQPNGIDTLTYVYYKSLDHILTKMFICLENFEDAIVAQEKDLMSKGIECSVEDIAQMKSTSFEAKRYLRLLTYIGDQILSNDNNLISEVNLKYFKNISTKINRLYEFGTNLHEKTEHLMDLYNTSVSEKSNNFLNKLTIITVFATPIAIFTGLYGMNFVNIPELQFEYGYFILLGVLFIILCGIFVYLKKSKML
ncbi:magnesium transporter CorA family protein [endosymbiont 'TC1' of Trimyema compressum]|uniref:magnesium transporter CorA family protein n=1 Tax=endosymbiont 'TC1' of Trimyema compressum TaxID=243899 RepID=UPI001FE1888E|nr:CorA family divalent cation transporter [endosymbiont 'TC1' of Trimyema compressum]